MKRFLLLKILILTFTFSLISCGAQQYFLLISLRSQLQHERFGELYDQSADSVHVNVSREEFIQRLKVVVTKLKAIDEGLNFQRDIETEKMFSDDSTRISAYQKLEKEGKSVVVIFTWDGTGKFRDLSVHPANGTSQGCTVYGVSYKTISVSPSLATPCP